MAEPIQFPQANSTWVGVGEVEDLPSYRENVESISCWKLTEAELDEVKRTGVVWLHVWGGHPPVSLAGESPFEDVGEQ